MQKKDTLPKILSAAVMRGSAIAVGAILVFFFIASVTVDYTPGMTFTAFITLTAFSMVVSFSAELHRLASVPPIVRRLLHFTVIGAAYFFVLLVTTKAYAVGYILYAVVYAILVGIAALIRHLRAPRGEGAAVEEKPSYTNRFS